MLVDGEGDALRTKSYCDFDVRFSGVCVATLRVSCDGRVFDGTTVATEGAYEDGDRDTVDADACRYHWSFGGRGGGFCEVENLLNKLSVERRL